MSGINFTRLLLSTARQILTFRYHHSQATPENIPPCKCVNDICIVLPPSLNASGFCSSCLPGRSNNESILYDQITLGFCPINTISWLYVKVGIANERVISIAIAFLPFLPCSGDNSIKLILCVCPRLSGLGKLLHLRFLFDL